MAYCEKLTLKNFRGISNLEYVPKKVNLIVGPNNVGKTSLIDAVYFAHTGESPPFSNFPPSSNLRLHSDYASIESGEHKYLYYDDPKKMSKEDYSVFQKKLNQKVTEFFNRYVELSDKTESTDMPINQIEKYFVDTKKVCATKFDGHIKVGPHYGDLSNASKEIHEIIRKVWPNIEGTGKGDRSSVLFYRAIEVFFEDLEEPVAEKDKIRYISPPEEIYEGFRFKPRRARELENFIKESGILPQFERLIEDNVVYSNKDIIPLLAHGSGFIRLLQMLSEIREAANGIAIVEEPENHLHPGYQRLFVEQILSMSRKHSIQIFVTSHSCDLVEELANQAKRSSSVQISRINKNEETHEVYNYSPKEALGVMKDLTIDLRGF